MSGSRAVGLWRNPARTDPVGPRPAGRRESPVPGAGNRPTALLLVSAALGALAGAYLVAAGPTLGSHLTAGGLWFFDGPETLSPDRLGVDSAVVLTGVALGVWVLAWVLAGMALRRGASFTSLLVVGLGWALPLVVGPPLFSPDVYSYAAIGASVHHGVNPFLHGPGVLGDLPAVRGAERFWRDSPTPYSPPFVALLAGVSWAFQEGLLAVVAALRVVEIAAWGALVLLVRWIAPRFGADPRSALWLGLLNPLVLLSGISAAHNDLLMTALLVAGLGLAMQGRPLIGAVCCALAADLKVVAIVAVVVIAVDAAVRRVGLWSRLRALVAIGAAGCGAFLVTVQLSGWGWTWVRDLSVPGQALEPLSPATALAMVIDPAHPPLVTVRSAALALAGLVCLVLLTRVPRWGPVRVTAWALFAVVALGPSFWPWYFLAPAVLLAIGGTRAERVFAGALSAALLFVTLPGGGPVLSLLPRPMIDSVMVGLDGVLVLAALLRLLLGLRRRRRVYVWSGNWAADPVAVDGRVHDEDLSRAGGRAPLNLGGLGEAGAG